jgi:hypothetical protein
VPVLRVVGGLFGILAWIVLLGLQRVWRSTFGWIFRTLAALLDKLVLDVKFVHWEPFGGVADWLRSLDRNISYALAIAANKSEHLAVWLFSRIAYVVRLLGREIDGLAADVVGAFTRFARATIPRLVRSLLKLLWRTVRGIVSYARKMIPQLLRKITRFAKWATNQISRAARHLGFLWKWAKYVLRKHWQAIRAALKLGDRLLAKLTPKGFRKLLLFAFGGLGILWVITDNVRLVGKWLAREPVQDVREWVHDATQAVNFCTLSAFQYDVAVHVVEPLLTSMVSQQDWYCTLDGDSLPSAVTAKPGYLGAWEPSATPARPRPLISKRLAPELPLPQRTIL